MVRLRREIEGIVVDRAIPSPAYTQSRSASDMVLPGFDAVLAAVSGPRILIAGAPRLALATALAEAGHQVTVTDLLPDQLSRLHGRLTPAAAGRMNLVDNRYSESSFSASSFDSAIYSDLLHCHPKAEWLIHKLHRELKVEGRLYIRLYAQGAPAALKLPLGHPGPPPLSAAEQSAALAGQTLAMAVEGLAARRLAAVVLDASGREAVDRGAHLPARAFAGDVVEQLEAVGSRLRVETVQLGHSIRCRLANLSWGARGPVRVAITRCAKGLPALADKEDLSRESPRVIGVVARKALADLGKRRRFG